MPFQSEKQRRYLHANHPEIAKRWEEEYATGGIANHFRKKFKEGSYSRSYNPGAGGVVQHGPIKTKPPKNGGGGGDGPPSIVHVPKGPTAAEIAAAKAAAAAKKKAEAEAKHKNWLHQKAKEKKKKVKHYSNIRPFGFTEYEKLIKPGLYDHYKKNLPSYDSEGVELRTERVLDNLDILKNIKRGGIKGNVNENISPFGQTFQTFDYKYDPYKTTSENFWEGHNTLVTPAGLNKAQTEYLDKVAKKGVVKESGQFFTYDKPTDVRAKLKELDEKSEEWIGTDVNPDKIVSGDPTTYATDKDVKEYLQKKYPGMQLKDDSGRTLAIDLATGGIANHFKFKNGGNATKNIKGQPHMLAYITPGEAKTLENLGGQKTMTKEGIPAYPPSDNYGGDWGGSSNEDKGETSSDSGWSPGVSHSGMPSDTGAVTSDAGWDNYMAPTVTNIDGSNIIDNDDTTDAEDLIETYTNVKDRYERNKTKKNWQMVVNVLTGSIFGAAKTAYGMNKDKKAYEEMLGKLKADALELGIPAYSPHTDTLPQIIGQEIIDINKKPKEKENDGPDGDAYPVVPVHQEIQEYEQMAWDPMSYLDQIRSKQAQRASLQAKGIIQDNETMTLNSGGLANLFRVKNY